MTPAQLDELADDLAKSMQRDREFVPCCPVALRMIVDKMLRVCRLTIETCFDPDVPEERKRLAAHECGVAGKEYAAALRQELELWPPAYERPAVN